MSTSSRVIKNTIYLYLRMIVSIFVSLYSTRLILQALGEEDFGIFNVIGGSIAMMGFLNSSLSNATQRYTSWALGKGERIAQIKVFNVTIVIQLLIGLLTVGVLLSVMPLLFGDVLNINQNRISEAKIVYYCLIFSSFLTIINVPYEALINAHENMGYYTVVGFIESFLKLTIALLCLYTSTDKLVLYGVLMALLPLITLSIMKVYCHKKYPECIINPSKYFDKEILKSISKFSGWNFLTAISHIASLQGMGLVLNHFYGSILNAAQGISNQVNGLFSTFSQNMMKAINPVITKKTALGEVEISNVYSLSGCKYSSFLFLLIGVPVTININYILKIWLTEVPDWTHTFCIMQFIFLIITQMTSAIGASIYATGKIKHYAVFKSITNILPIFAIYFAFSLGGNPIWLYIPVILFLGVGGNCVILFYAKKECNLSIKSFFYKVNFPIIGCLCFMLLLGLPILMFNIPEFLKLLLSSGSSLLGFFSALAMFGITNEEKKILKELRHEMSLKYVSINHKHHG